MINSNYYQMDANYCKVFAFYVFCALLSLIAFGNNMLFLAYILFYPIYLTLVCILLMSFNIANFKEIVQGAAAYGVLNPDGLLILIVKCGIILFVTVGAYFYHMACKVGPPVVAEEDLLFSYS